MRAKVGGVVFWIRQALGAKGCRHGSSDRNMRWTEGGWRVGVNKETATTRERARCDHDQKRAGKSW